MYHTKPTSITLEVPPLLHSGVADGGDADDGAVRAGDDAIWSDDSSSLGGVGVSGAGKASALFGDDGGVEGGKSDVLGGVVGGEGVGGVANSGVADGGVADGGVAGADRGERSRLALLLELS